MLFSCGGAGLLGLLSFLVLDGVACCVVLYMFSRLFLFWLGKLWGALAVCLMRFEWSVLWVWGCVVVLVFFTLLCGLVDYCWGWSGGFCCCVYFFWFCGGSGYFGW